MVDQFTNRQSLRSSSLRRRNQSSQSLQPSQQSTRVTRSRSRDVVEAEEREPASSRKRRKVTNDEENAVSSSAQEVGKRGARSKGPQGLPAVTEELIGEGIRSQGQMLQEPELSEASTPNFGTTARTLSAAQDFSKSNSTKSRQKRDMGNAEAIHNPASTIATERSVPKTTGSRISNTSFHAPKNLKPAARHLFQRKSESGTAKAIQKEHAQEEVENSRTTESTAVAETTVAEIASPGKSRDVINQVSQSDRPQVALDRDDEGDDNWRLQEFTDDEEVLVASEQISPPNPVARARQVVGLQASIEARHNRENISEHVDQPVSRSTKSFIDRQDNAERLIFDSQEEVPLVSENQDQHPRRREDNTQKHVPAAELQELDSGDEQEFQSDRRQIARQTRRARISSTKRSAPAPSVRRHSPKRVPVASTDRNPSEEIGSAATRHEQEHAPAPSQFENYKNANKVAKFKNLSLIKNTQKRRAWTNEETEALIELIEEHGVSWAFLKQKDELEKLERRDQVALKDKARNMKFDFLKAGTFLPHNFDGISLNKYQTDKLHELGIDY